MTDDTATWIKTMLPGFWVLCFLLSIGAGVIKGRAFSGFLWGLLLGPIGLVIVLLVLPDLKKQKLKEEAAREADEALRRYQASRRP
jgi:hypothetical protein